MSQVLIRDVAPRVVASIKRRARKRGVSMQKELHAIITCAAEGDIAGATDTVYPPVRPVVVRGKPASCLLVEDRR